MLELLLELLWSKTLTAPSFGRYWKQPILRPYCAHLWKPALFKNKDAAKMFPNGGTSSEVPNQGTHISFQTSLLDKSAHLQKPTLFKNKEVAKVFSKSVFQTARHTLRYLIEVCISLFGPLFWISVFICKNQRFLSTKKQQKCFQTAWHALRYLIEVCISLFGPLFWISVCIGKTSAF